MFTHNLTIYRGTTFSERLVWTENSVPVDMTGWKAKTQIRSSVTNAAYILSTDGGEITLGAAGEIDLELDTEATATMLPGSYVWDILLMNPQGSIRPPIVSGTVTVLQGVTVW